MENRHGPLMDGACPAWLLEIYDRDPSEAVTRQGRTQSADAWVRDCVDCWLHCGRILDI